jgi:hypothetical protein
MAFNYLKMCCMAKKKKHPLLVELGRQGGKASAAKLTPEQRREKARKAALTRWIRRKNKS